MIFGIGIDIVEIDRFQASVDRFGARFYQKVFTATELEYCLKKVNWIESLAVRWAAKEAFSKAIGTGWRKPFHWKAIEILNDPAGKPFISLNGELVNLLKNKMIQLSLSHSRNNAIAFVVIEENIQHEG
ncbi:holo-ACP synthase [candidate division KSB1 bacterium]|nr:holo-ACP synthase [candidate division KSB1 bacterium]